MVVLTRRNFLAAGGVAALGAATLSKNRYVFGAPGNPATGDTLIVIFLRGGADGLHMVGPIDRGDYQDIRGRIAPEATQPLDQGSSANANIGIDGLFLHPQMEALYNGLWAEGKMALVPGTGIDQDNFGFDGRRVRLGGHFDAQRYNEKGTGSLASNSGWMARFVEAQGQSGAIGSIQKDKGDSLLLNGTDVVSINDLESLAAGGGLSGFPDSNTARVAIEQMVSGDDSISTTGQRALQSATSLESLDADILRPNYPRGDLGDGLAEAATILQAGIGVQAVEINTGGWDHHKEIVKRWDGRMADLCEGIQQLAADTNGLEEVTVVVTTEFGRRMEVNGDAGTDHGAGRTEIILGNGIAGGIYGDYPESFADLDRSFPIINDYRRILAEVTSVRGDVANVESVFPGYNPDSFLGFTVPS